MQNLVFILYIALTFCFTNGFISRVSKVNLYKGQSTKTDIIRFNRLKMVTAEPPPTQTVVTAAEVSSQYELSPQQFVYVCLTTVFVTCLIIADVIGVKLFGIKSMLI